MGLLPLILNRIPQLLLPFLMGLATGGLSYVIAGHEMRHTNAPLRRRIEARVCFSTRIDHARVIAIGGFWGIRGVWTPLPGSQRLTVGTHAFMISAPHALLDYVLTGPGTSIAVTQAPSRRHPRDWILITGKSGRRRVRLAITHDNLPAVWQALAGTGAALLSSEPAAPDLSGPWGRPRAGSPVLRRLAAALTIVLMADMAAWLGTIALPSLGGLAYGGVVVAAVMFLVWFYCARASAEGHGWPQRRSPAWAIAGWFVPVVFLWFPFQIMADIWRAGLPAGARANRAILPGMWWACCLAFFSLSTFIVAPARQIWYLELPVKIAGVLAAIITALLVRKVSDGRLADSGTCRAVTGAPVMQ